MKKRIFKIYAFKDEVEFLDDYIDRLVKRDKLKLIERIEDKLEGGSVKYILSGDIQLKEIIDNKLKLRIKG